MTTVTNENKTMHIEHGFFTVIFNKIFHLNFLLALNHTDLYDFDGEFNDEIQYSDIPEYPNYFEVTRDNLTGTTSTKLFKETIHTASGMVIEKLVYSSCEFRDYDYHEYLKIAYSNALSVSGRGKHHTFLQPMD